jgi:hypothetical protein
VTNAPETPGAAEAIALIEVTNLDVLVDDLAMVAVAEATVDIAVAYLCRFTMFRVIALDSN